MKKYFTQYLCWADVCGTYVCPLNSMSAEQYIRNLPYQDNKTRLELYYTEVSDVSKWLLV